MASIRSERGDEWGVLIGLCICKLSAIISPELFVICSVASTYRVWKFIVKDTLKNHISSHFLVKTVFFFNFFHKI